ncbi:MAG TPA: DUF302 domain-containing protein, partial [Candidatus Acidoferrum sp.]|nr:DUF302 domain-containing protein [Candidatus Acidoferrum sp.]
MFARILKICSAVLLASGLLLSTLAAQAGGVGDAAADDGLVRVKSAYPLDETIARLEKDIADKKLMFFGLIDQSKLAADAGIALRPSSLLIFGNPGLGSQFMTSNPASGIDWPVRLLVFEDAQGQVWAVYNDFARIAQRHGITDRDAQFKMAAEVIASITSSVQAK